jgi:hypothetical protein
MTDPNADSPRRKLKIDLADLELAFDNASWEAEYYLDRETGEIILIGSMIMDSDAITEQIENVTDETRYLRVPHAEPRDGYRDMERFIETVMDQNLRQLLGVAIQGKGAFRRFKDVLLDYPQERERWFRFQEDRVRQRVLDWLDLEDIEPITG